MEDFNQPQEGVIPLLIASQILYPQQWKGVCYIQPMSFLVISHLHPAQPPRGLVHTDLKVGHYSINL